MNEILNVGASLADAREPQIGKLMRAPASGAPTGLTITRREAVIRMAVAMGASVVGPRLLAADFGMTASAGNTSFTADELALLDDIGDTIIPATDVPGAKAVNIGAFIAMMVRDCYQPRDQAAFKEGLSDLATRFATVHHTSFREATAEQRTHFLNALDAEQKEFTKAHRVEQHTDGSETPEPPYHYFRMMKELTILGYFSSEIGATQALRFVEVPGSFNGATPYKKGNRAWFS